MSIKIVIFDLFALSNIYAIYYGIRNFRHLGTLKLFIIMLLASAIQSVFVVVAKTDDNVDLSILIYIFIEFTVIVGYFIKSIKNPKITRPVIYILFACFMYLVFVFYFDRLQLNPLNPFFLIFETIFLLILSMFHFLEIFENEKVSNLTRCPEFFVTSAIVFYFSITCPAFLLAAVIKNPFVPFKAEINYLSYLVFNISLLQSFKWKKLNT